MTYCNRMIGLCRKELCSVEPFLVSALEDKLLKENKKVYSIHLFYLSQVTKSFFSLLKSRHRKKTRRQKEKSDKEHEQTLIEFRLRQTIKLQNLMNKKSLVFKAIYFKIWKSPVQAFTKTLAKVLINFMLTTILIALYKRSNLKNRQIVQGMDNSSL